MTPIFVKPAGIRMGPDDVPNSGISLSNALFLICNSGSDTHEAPVHLHKNP
jgi:hypothetical protein